MRKIVAYDRISVDGFYSGANGEIDWFIHDSEVDKALHAMIDPDTILFGRVTYQMFENYWPQVGRDADAPKEARMVADELDQMTKVVFSTTLLEVTWQNSILVKGDVANEVKTLKHGNGPDIVIFGSGTIVQQLANEGLIDEYLLAVTPVVLGAGKSLFEDVKQFNLKHFGTRQFESGNVLIHYRSNR